MKPFVGFLMASLLGGLVAVPLGKSFSASEPTWRVVYAHDAEGQALEGSKTDLIAAVEAGKPVRVYWAGTRVQHVTDSHFLTILQGEVFAQIAVMRAQKPSVDPPEISFHDPDRPWNTIFSTRGGQALKWIVQD